MIYIKINWKDYYLAGINGRQMLLGLAEPGMVGLLCGIAIHGICYYTTSFLLILLEDVPFGSDNFWVILVLGATPIFGLLYNMIFTHLF